MTGAFVEKDGKRGARVRRLGNLIRSGDSDVWNIVRARHIALKKGLFWRGVQVDVGGFTRQSP